jgi:hypothetical protein
LTNTDILMLQHFRSPEDVAVYYAAAKTFMLIAFVHFAVSAAVAHRFSEYHVAGDRERLKRHSSPTRSAGRSGSSLAAAVAVLPPGKPPAVAVRRAVRRRLLSDVHPRGRRLSRARRSARSSGS